MRIKARVEKVKIAVGRMVRGEEYCDQSVALSESDQVMGFFFSLSESFRFSQSGHCMAEQLFVFWFGNSNRLLETWMKCGVCM